MADLYGDLGLGRGASPEEVKAAYRRLASLHHPDRNAGDPEAEARFRCIQHAYDVLSDPVARARYDETGEDRESRVAEDPEADLHGAAVGLMDEVMRTVAEPWRVDVLASMLGLLTAKELTIKTACQKIRGNVGRLRRMQKRFRRRKGVQGLNALDGAIAQQIRLLEAQLETFAVAIANIDQVRAYVQTYEFDVEVAPPVVVMTSAS